MMTTSFACGSYLPAKLHPQTKPNGGKKWMSYIQYSICQWMEKSAKTSLIHLLRKTEYHSFDRTRMQKVYPQTDKVKYSTINFSIHGRIYYSFYEETKLKYWLIKACY